MLKMESLKLLFSTNKGKIPNLQRVQRHINYYSVTYPEGKCFSKA